MLDNKVTLFSHFINRCRNQLFVILSNLSFNEHLPDSTMMLRGVTFSSCISVTVDKKSQAFPTVQFILLAYSPKRTARYVSSGAFCPLSDYQLQRLDNQGQRGRNFILYSETTSKISSQFMSEFNSLTKLLGKNQVVDLVKGNALSNHFILLFLI